MIPPDYGDTMGLEEVDVTNVSITVGRMRRSSICHDYRKSGGIMMKKSLFVLGLTLCLIFVLSACGGDSKSSEPAVAPTGVTEEVTITAKNFEFLPAEIKVKKGDTIKLTFNSEEGIHGLMIKDFDINMDESGTKEFVADKVGTFDFSCSIMCGGGHGQMVGKITVE